MPSVNINTTHKRGIVDIGNLTNYITDSVTLEAKYQYMIGEVVMLRLFGILEHSIAEIALKLACGCNYRNGKNPLVKKQCRSMRDAFSNMLVYNRRKPKNPMDLKWTKANLIKESIEHVLDTNDSFYNQIQIHNAVIDEMRRIRNHVAHRSNGTKKEFISIQQNIYNGKVGLTMGAFLVSTSRHATSNIQRYIGTTTIILNDITSGI